MPRDLSRQPRDETRKLSEQIVAQAVQVLVVSGGIAQSSIGGGLQVNLQVLGTDGQPRERHPFMLGVDGLDSTDAYVGTQGRTYSATYYDGY